MEWSWGFAVYNKKVGNWPTQRPMPCRPFTNSSANFREGPTLGPKTYKCDIRVSGVHIIVRHVNLSIGTKFRQNRLNVSEVSRLAMLITLVIKRYRMSCAMFAE